MYQAIAECLHPGAAEGVRRAPNAMVLTGQPDHRWSSRQAAALA